MKTGFLSVFLLLGMHLFSSAQDVELSSDYTSLLTSRIWNEGNENEFIILYKFNADGTFFRTSSSPWLAAIDPSFNRPMDEMGKWEWISKDAFTIQTTQRVIDGQIRNLNPEPYHKAVYRIHHIDLQTIKGVKYNILEKEDSEYVTQFKWVVKE